jgi:hypothetical protein
MRIFAEWRGGNLIAQFLGYRNGKPHLKLWIRPYPPVQDA